MKRKSFILFVITALVAIFALGCGKAYTFDPYDKYTGVDETAILIYDDYVTLDGVLDEQIWAESKTAINIAGATRDNMSGGAVDVELYGERNATVYTYIGEKAVYFAFEVQDKNLYYNSSESQGSSTCVEVYFTNSAQTTCSNGCYSVRVNPTGKEGEASVNIGTYRPNGTGSDWVKNKMRGKVAACATVDGSVMSSSGDTTYSTENNKGYVVEIAVAKETIGMDATSFQYTAAFVQDRGFDLKRINNSFIAGTSYIGVGSWKLVTNDGVVADKNAFFDQAVTPDEGMTIDGKLDEAMWTGAQGRTVEYSAYKNKNNENVTITTYAVTTDLGIYVGLESNDSNVYYHEGARAVYNTGAELLITAGKADKINADTTVQYRYNVGGSGQRYRGRTATQSQIEAGSTWYPYQEQYFPAKAAGSVIADAEGEGMNTGNSDGWMGEIFIPWTALNMENYEYRDGVAIMVCGFRSYEDSGTVDHRNYLAPVGANIYGNGSQVSCNPQDDWFLFENGKPIYKPLSFHDVAMDANDRVTTGTDDYYQAVVSASYTDDVVRTANVKEIFPAVSGGTFDFGVEGVEATDNGDGTYLIKVPADKADEFATLKAATFTSNSGVSTFNVGIDANFALDGALNDAAWASVNKFITVQTEGKTVNNEFAAAFGENALYLSATITDAVFAGSTEYQASKAVGLELYFNVNGQPLSSANTYQVRLLTNEDARIYTYLDQAGSDGWSWDGPFYSDSIRKEFVIGSGYYTLEARIPYSVFGLTEKPDSMEIATFTKYISNDNGNITTKLFGMQGNLYSRDASLYLNYDETGLAPNSVVMKNAVNQSIPTIELIKGIGITAGNYTGKVQLSLFADGTLPITDAMFGAFDSYVVKTEAASGYYTYSIPTAAFADTDTLTIPVTSATYNLSTMLTVNVNELDKLYATVNGRDSASVWPSAVSSVGGTDYYTLEVAVFGDENKLVPVYNADLEVTFAIEGVTGIQSTAVGNVYTVYVPVSAITANVEYELIISADEVESGSVIFVAKALSNDATNTLMANTLMFLDFEDGVNNVATVNGGAASMRRGSASISDGIYTMNQSQRAIKVENVTLGDSFTYSLLVNGSDVKKLHAEHYANALIATNSVDGVNGFFIGVRSTRLYVKIGGQDDTIIFNDALSAVGNGFERWTFVVTKANGVISVNMFIDGRQVANGSYAAPAGHSFNNADKAFGIGAPYVDDMADPSKYVQTSKGDTVDKHNIRIDNVILYNGVMDADTMAAIDGYAGVFGKNLTWTANSALNFDFMDVLDEDSISMNLGAMAATEEYLAGATFTGLPEGVSADTKVEWSNIESDYVLTVAAADYEKFLVTDEVVLVMNLRGARKEISVVYTPLDALAQANAVTLYTTDKAADKYVFTVKITDGTGAVGIDGVTFADGWTATATGTPGEYSVEVAASVVEANPTTEVALSKEFNGSTVTGTLTVNYVVWGADQIADAADVYLDFNGELFDRAGEANAIRTKGTPDLTTNVGSVGLKNNTNIVYVDNAALGAEDFTLSVDLYIPADQFSGCNAGYEFVASGSNIDSGHDSFQLSAHKDHGFRIQIGANSQTFGQSVKDQTTLDSWINVTYVVDRNVGTTPGKRLSSTAYANYLAEENVKTYLYINGALVQDMDYNLPTGQVLGTGTMRLGSAEISWNSAGKKTFSMDNFVLIQGQALNASQIKAISQYTARETVKNMWNKSGDIEFNFTQDGNTEYTDSIVLTKLTDTAALENVTFSENIASYIGTPVVSGLTTTYPVTIPRDKYDDFIGGVDATVTVNGVTKPIRIVYNPIDAVYFKAVKLYTTDIAGDSYTFNVQAYADNAYDYEITDIDFTATGGWTFEKQSDGTYNVTVTKAVMEGENRASKNHEIAVSKTITTGTVNGSLKVEYVKWTADEIAANAEVFLDFDNGLGNAGSSNKTVTMQPYYKVDGSNNLTSTSVNTVATYAKGSSGYAGDYAYVANQGLRLAAINEVSLGTDDFIVSSDINGQVFKNMTTNGYTAILFGTNNVDGLGKGISIQVRQNVFRVKYSDGAVKSTYNFENIAIPGCSTITSLWANNVFDGWHNWTFVFDRQATNTVITFYLDGAYAAKATVPVAAAVSLDNNGNTFGVGARGEHSSDGNNDKESQISNYGNYSYTIPMDNFMFYRGYMDASQVKAISQYTASRIDARAFDVADVLITGNTAFNANLDVRATSDSTAVTDGVTFAWSVENENVNDYIVLDGGVYKLSVPADKLALFDDGVTVTATRNGIEKTFVIARNYLTEAEISDIAGKAKAYFAFDGNTNNAIDSGVTTSMRRGTAEFEDGKYVANQNKRALKLSNLELGENFVLSFKMDAGAVASMRYNHYANAIFTSYKIDGDNSFLFAARCSTLYFKIYNKTIQFANDVLLNRATYGDEIWTVAITSTPNSDGTTKTVTIKFFIDGKLMATKSEAAIPVAHSFNNANKTFGIGAPAEADDPANPASYTNVNAYYDDFLVVNGTLTDNQLANLAGNYAAIVAAANA